MKIVLVGGTWDHKGGKASKIIKNMYEAIKFLTDDNLVICRNGGYYTNLPYLLKNDLFATPIDIMLWFPNVANGFEKHTNIKSKLPKAMLVTSKNNYDKNYSFQELTAHALSLKSNLFVEITRENQRYHGQVFDPLGNAWSGKTADFAGLARIIIKRCEHLKDITRKPTVWSPETPDQIPVTEENVRFFGVVNKSADKFHELIHPAEGVKRFLGNASFRCMNGFPSLRSPDGSIYVSRRNIDKRDLGFDKFVQVGYNRDKDITWYRGENKPSVDTVVQVQLYSMLRHINYMIHSHVYVEGAPFTENMVPCGGIEEVEEIKRAIYKHGIDQDVRFAINLVGHGSLICVKTTSGFWSFNYTKRPSPELMYKKE